MSKIEGRYPGGIAVCYSPINQAYLILWHGRVLRVINSEDETRAEVLRIVGDTVE